MQHTIEQQQRYIGPPRRVGLISSITKSNQRTQIDVAHNIEHLFIPEVLDQKICLSLPATSKQKNPLDDFDHVLIDPRITIDDFPSLHGQATVMSLVANCCAVVSGYPPWVQQDSTEFERLFHHLAKELGPGATLQASGLGGTICLKANAVSLLDNAENVFSTFDLGERFFLFRIAIDSKNFARWGVEFFPKDSSELLRFLQSVKW